MNKGNVSMISTIEMKMEFMMALYRMSYVDIMFIVSDTVIELCIDNTLKVSFQLAQ